MKYFKKLLGDDIYLSPRNTEDAEKYVEWINDFQITDYTGKSASLTTIESENKYLQEHINDEASFGIVRLKDDKLLGSVSLKYKSYKQVSNFGNLYRRKRRER